MDPLDEDVCSPPLSIGDDSSSSDSDTDDESGNLRRHSRLVNGWSICDWDKYGIQKPYADEVCSSCH